MLLVFLAICMTGCYERAPYTTDAWDLTDKQVDSISFYTTHHYTQNFNFIVKSDSLVIKSDLHGEASPEFIDENAPIRTDSFVLRRHDQIVVADIKSVPTDSIDSVWVKVARDQLTIGWVHEKDMLPAVSPDDPISQFIDAFSNKHMLIFLALLVVVVAVYGLSALYRRHAWLVHFKDIPSCYPTLLALLVAISATFYSSIQLFGAEMWRHFYYHPTLNPFAVPPTLGIFLISVWGIVILFVAVLDDVRRHLSMTDTFFYLLGLAGVCAIDYVVFSVSTLYYIGYPLLVCYIVFSLYRYFSLFRNRYICGQCGARLQKKGTCPHCGAMNV